MIHFISKLRCLLCFFAIIFVLTIPTIAQEKDWRDVSSSELKATSSQIESDAPAEAIFWNVRIEQTTQEVKEDTYVRIKIFDERGVKIYSTISVDYYAYYELDNFRARLIQPDGKIFELKKDEIILLDTVKTFYSKSKKKSFVIPNIRPGSIVEYKYQLRARVKLQEWKLIFQHNIPIQEINYFVRGDISWDTLKIMRFNVKDFEYQKTKDGFTLARMKNISALKGEPNFMPKLNLVPWILLYYDGNNSVKPEKYWDNYAKSFGFLFDKLESGDEIKQTVRQLTKGKNSDEEKISAIFNFCRTSLKNFSYDNETDKEKLSKAIREDWSPKEVLRRKEGFDFGIDKLFASLVIAAGFEISFVFTGDRREFFFLKQYAHGSLLNYSGIAVKTSDGWHFCNPGAKFVPKKHLYWFSEGQDVLVVGKKDYEWTKLPVSPPEYNKSEQKAYLKLMPDGSLEGTVKSKFFGFIGAEYKLAYNKMTENEVRETMYKSLKERLSNFDFELKSVKREIATDEPFEVEYNIKISDYAQITERRIFFQPGFFEYRKKPLFQNATRHTPINFENFNWDVQEIKIELPNNFNPEAVVSTQTISETGIVDFNISSQFNSETHLLEYKRSFIFGENGRLLYQVGSYPLLKSLFDRIANADSTVIILKKKDT